MINVWIASAQKLNPPPNMTFIPRNSPGPKKGDITVVTRAGDGFGNTRVTNDSKLTPNNAITRNSTNQKKYGPKNAMKAITYEATNDATVVRKNAEHASANVPICTAASTRSHTPDQNSSGETPPSV